MVAPTLRLLPRTPRAQTPPRRLLSTPPSQPFSTTPLAHTHQDASPSSFSSTPIPPKRPAVGPRLAALRRAGAPSTKTAARQGLPASQITAMCLAESFTMPAALRLLKQSSLRIDPHVTGLSPSEVIHAQPRDKPGDIFVFRSGTVVTWGIPLSTVTPLLVKAAVVVHPEKDREVEDLDYTEDATKETCWLKGDLITLGTKAPATPPPIPETSDPTSIDSTAHNITLAKVAFSSALARSTRLAMLENKMESYGSTTNDFTLLPLDTPATLRSSRWMILQLSKDLLILRARLNHHSELTDPIPDLFWDSRAELGLERYFEAASKALDIRVRIGILNQRLDYAQEIVGTVRTMGTEQESTRLEWIIIVLITVEVIFETRRIVAEVQEESRAKIERLARVQGIEIDPVTQMPMREPVPEKTP